MQVDDRLYKIWCDQDTIMFALLSLLETSLNDTLRESVIHVQIEGHTVDGSVNE